MQILNEVISFVVGGGLGAFVTYEIVKGKLNVVLRKLETIKNEIEHIEKTEERRVIIPILRVTARVKALL